MNSTPAPNEEDLFHRALALPAADRAAFLDRECAGEASLRAALDSLLQHHTAAGSFMQSAAPGLAATVAHFAPRTEEKAGDIIGRYKLLQKIGEGGCGVVYMAEQEKPVRRRVALKVIKLGMDTKEVIARFEAERQALAMMDHPNIAKVLDAGATELGRPYFVMELVRGVPITKYCDEAKLSAKARLELFIPVCHAIQHAHQKGIIHRDIKPSNVLVTVNDGVAVPKVIDFGIAKATHGRLTNATLFTAFEQFIGTPAYMSPEQAAMTSLDIDTRSDIYSLGVLLYELLTGRPPFDARELVQVGLDEMRRQIREVEPSRPSTRISTMSGADQATTANLRQIEAPKLVNLLRGDLDWVVMRCLEKDRSRRYETATSLAQDVQRHLDNEAVVARPAGNLYRLQKLIRRNRVAFAAGAVIAVSLIAGMVVSTWAYLNEKTAREIAVEAALAHKKASDFNRTIMIRAADYRREAEASGKKTAVETARGSYAVAALKNLIGDATAASPAEKARIAARLAPTADRLRLDAQIPPEAKQELCELIGDLYLTLGGFGQAEAMYRQTVTLRRELRGDGHPDTTAAEKKLIETLQQQGKGAEAAKTLGEAEQRAKEFLHSDKWVRALHKEARELQTLGRAAEAEAKLRAAMLAAQADRGDGYNPSADLGLIARLRFDAGDFSGAKRLAEQCIAAEKVGRPWHDAGTLGSFTRVPYQTYRPPYDAHTVLGLIALREGDKARAREHLLLSAAGVIPSTKFETKEIELAAALVANGEQATVIRFLSQIRPRYVDALEERSFENTIFMSRETEYYNAATGKEHAQALATWQTDLSAGKIPADWERPGTAENRAPPTKMPDLPPVSKLPVGPPDSVAGLYRSLFPFAFLMLGWCATAVAPKLSAGPRLPRPAAAWLIAFCVARTLDCALFTGAIIGDGFMPDMFLGIFISFFSWVFLWEFIRALAPGESSRRETYFMRGVLGFGLLEVLTMRISGYANQHPAFMVACMVGLLLTVLLMFALAFGVCIVAGRRIWRWQRTAPLGRGQRLSLKFAVPLLVVHGFVSIFAGIIHDQAGPAIANTVFWASALLPWLLTAGFAWRGAPISPAPNPELPRP